MFDCSLRSLRCSLGCRRLRRIWRNGKALFRHLLLQIGGANIAKAAYFVVVRRRRACLLTRSSSSGATILLARAIALRRCPHARRSPGGARSAARRRASSLGNAMLPRLGCMSGLLRPVGPEAAQTYWVRRGLVLGATMVLAVAVAVDHQRHEQPRLGSSGESVAFHRRLFGAEPGITKLDADSHAHAIGDRPLGFSLIDDSRAEGHHAESVDEEDRSERPGRLPSRGTPANPDWQAAPGIQTAHDFPTVLDQRLGPDLHRAGDQEELRVEDLFRQRPDLEHRGLSVRDQADHPQARLRTCRCLVI